MFLCTKGNNSTNVTNNRGSNHNNNTTANNTHKKNPPQQSVSRKDEHSFDLIFNILHEIKIELKELKDQTKSLSDKVDNMKLVQDDHNARISNIEYKLEFEEIGPGQYDGQVEHYGNF